MQQKSTPVDIRTTDAPRAVVALFPNEAAGRRALELLHAAGFKEPWLGLTKALRDGQADSIVISQQGGNWAERLMRYVLGSEDYTLYAALTDHGVADDVSRRLARKMPANGVVVIAGWTGDIREASRVLTAAGGRVIRGADGGVIGTPRPRLPSDEAPATVEP